MAFRQNDVITAKAGSQGARFMTSAARAFLGQVEPAHSPTQPPQAYRQYRAGRPLRLVGGSGPAPRCGDTRDRDIWREELWASFYPAAAERPLPCLAVNSSRDPLCQESVRVLAARHGVSRASVRKWKKRGFAADARMGPKDSRSTVLSVEQEAACIAFRRHAAAR